MVLVAGSTGFLGREICRRLRARGIAVVDQVSIAGGLLAGLAVRPFQSAEKLTVRILRNRYRPMAVAERAFVEAFDGVWKSMPTG